MVTRIVLVILAVIVMRHFGGGLLKVFQKEEEEQPILGKVTHIMDKPVSLLSHHPATEV